MVTVDGNHLHLDLSIGQNWTQTVIVFTAWHLTQASTVHNGNQASISAPNLRRLLVTFQKEWQFVGLTTEIPE